MCGGEMCGGEIYIHTFFSQGMENVEAETDVVIKV